MIAKVNVVIYKIRYDFRYEYQKLLVELSGTECSRILINKVKVDVSGLG